MRTYWSSKSKSTSVFGMRPAFSRIAIGMVTWPLEVMRMGKSLFLTRGGKKARQLRQSSDANKSSARGPRYFARRGRRDARAPCLSPASSRAKKTAPKAWRIGDGRGGRERKRGRHGRASRHRRRDPVRPHQGQEHRLRRRIPDRDRHRSQGGAHRPRRGAGDRRRAQRAARPLRLRVHHRRHRPDPRRHHRRRRRQGVRRVDRLRSARRRDSAACAWPRSAA